MTHRHGRAAEAPGPRAPGDRSGQDLLAGEDAETVVRLRDWHLARAAEAREDVVKFFEYVLEEEHTRAPIRPAAHQRVLLRFIEHHDRSVVMLPADHAKTFTVAGYTLFLVGKNPSSRGAIVSATEQQASKVVRMVRDYIETSPRLRIVFPHLRQSERPGDPWTQTAITVARPPGIRDPTLVAVGIDGALPGSRLNWIIADDLLNRENTATKEQRAKVYEFFDSTVLSRLDPRGAKVVVTNTVWHPKDLCHQLDEQGWASMRMQITGGILIRDDAEGELIGLPPFDSEELRPASDSPHDPWCRLVAHDPDPANDVSLFPERYPMRSEDPRQMTVERLRVRHLPAEFNRLYEQVARNDETSMCKQEYVDLCKFNARQKGFHSLSSALPFASDMVFTGVDLAVSPGEENDYTAFFTFMVLPGGWRLILDVDYCKLSGPEILRKLIAKQRAYNSVVRVENNAAQDYIRQFALDPKFGGDIGFPIKGHMTGRVKAHPEHGVPALFLEMSSGAWLIPNNTRGECSPSVQRWVDACLYYSPEKHTDDGLMASYFGREQAREWGALSGGDLAEEMARQGGPGIASAVMDR